MVFSYKLGIYYQAIVIYATTLVVYSAVVAMANGAIEHVFRDQVVYVLAVFTIMSIVGLIASAVMARRIEVYEDKIVFASRFHRRLVAAKDIVWVRIGREKRVKVRGAYRVAKVKLHTRRKLLRLRPSLWEHEDQLVEALRRLDVSAHRAAHHA
jgi:hypothetical protein